MQRVILVVHCIKYRNHTYFLVSKFCRNVQFLQNFFISKNFHIKKLGGLVHFQKLPYQGIRGNFGIIYSAVDAFLHLTLLGRRSQSYRNQSIDLQSKSMDWFLYDRDLRQERVRWRNASATLHIIPKFHLIPW